MLTPDQQRVKELLCETITLLCKNGLHFQSEFCIDGLIGITLDQDDVFLVSIKETVRHGEVFIRDRQHSVRSQVAEESSIVTHENRIPTSSESAFHLEVQLDSNHSNQSGLPEVSSKVAEEEPRAICVPVADSRISLMVTDEQVPLKSEEDSESDKSPEESTVNANGRRCRSSDVAENIRSSYGLSNQNDELLKASTADLEKSYNTECCKNSHPYFESMSTVICRDGAKQSPDVNSQISQDCSVQSMYSSTEALHSDKYYSGSGGIAGGPVNHNERKTTSNFSDFRQNCTSKLDGEESDGDELVVIKVEPPSSGYTEEQCPGSSSYNPTQANHVLNFVSDVCDNNCLYSRIKDRSGYTIKQSHSLSSFDYNNPMLDASGYSQLQISRYQTTLGMNQGTTPNEPSPQSPHVSGDDKTKPYRRMDGRVAPDMLQMFPVPEVNLKNLTENETMVQTDIEKYAEMQSFCMNRRARSTFTAYQLQRLESAFKCAHYVDAATRSKLAEELHLSDSIILVWFQNRRQKFKKQLKMSFS